MSLKSVLGKVGDVLGDVAKVAFNAIPLVPNIPSSSFSSSAIGKVSNVVSGVTDAIGGTVASIIPGGNVLKAAGNIVGSLIPSTASQSKASSALPTSIPTNGATTMMLQSTVKPIASAVIAGVTGKSANAQVPNTIGLFQQTAAAPTSVGSKVQVPINSSGIGYFTQDVPPVAITNGGYITGSAGLLAKAPAGVGNVTSVLPSSDPLEKIIDTYGKYAGGGNAPTNPSTPQQTKSDDSTPWLIGGVLAVLGFIAWLFSRK